MSQRAELSHKWRGDDIKYEAAHYRHGKALPEVCAYADESCKGRLEIAFRRETPDEFVVKTDPKGRPYSIRVEDYMRLCASHHSRYDGAGAHNARKTHCKHGHEYTPENTYRSRNARTCRTCTRARMKKRDRSASALSKRAAGGYSS